MEHNLIRVGSRELHYQLNGLWYSWIREGDNWICTEVKVEHPVISIFDR